jgi:membrane protease YdiL (CAAX protease family)
LRVIEILVAVALLVAARWLVLTGWGPIQNLFEESQDNESWVYVAFGAPFWLAALLCVAGALTLVIHATKRRNGLTNA